MRKLIYLLPLLLIIACEPDTDNSIILDVDQTIKIPVEYVSVTAEIEVDEESAPTAEERGYKKLSQTVDQLEKWGYKKGQLEISSGEIRQQTYRGETNYQYDASISFDIMRLDKIDPIRQALLQQGIGGFRITDYKNTNEDSLYSQAYRKAIQRAKEKAAKLLTDQQISVGKVLTLSQDVNSDFEVVETKQSGMAGNVVLDEMTTEPLFQKEFYEQTISFTIKFAIQ